MANAGKTTKRTKLIDTCHSPLQSWVKNHLHLKQVPTNDNSSATLTKSIHCVCLTCMMT